MQNQGGLQLPSLPFPPSMFVFDAIHAQALSVFKIFSNENKTYNYDKPKSSYNLS